MQGHLFYSGLLINGNIVEVTTKVTTEVTSDATTELSSIPTTDFTTGKNYNHLYIRF